MHPSEHPHKRAGQDLESWLLGLRPADLASLVDEHRRLQQRKARLERDLQQALGRNAELELKLDALELDAQRVHHFLDEFEVPRYLENPEEQEGDARRAPATELSLLGRVEVVLEEDDEEE